MAGMTKARRQVAEDLQQVGFTVKDHIPEKIVPPLVVISAGEPMLEEGNTLNGAEFQFNLRLLVLIGTKPNAATVDLLEEHVERLIFNLGDWTITNVGGLVMMEVSQGFIFPSIEISINKILEIEGGE